jgi:guanylate kinase
MFGEETCLKSHLTHGIMSIYIKSSNMKKTIITITGPSGSGKSELLAALCKTGKFARLLSVTTRQPRTGEVDGVDYRFTTEAIFKRLMAEDQFVQTVHFQGLQYYGTLSGDATEAINSGNVPVTIIEPTGIPQFQKFADENGYTLLTIFVQAEFEILIQRYLSRLSPDDLAKPERVTYHAKRISAIHSEHTDWQHVIRFNCTFMNSGSNLQYLEEMADMVSTYIKEE